MKKIIMVLILLTITGCTTLSKDQCISYKDGYSCYTDGKWVEIPPLTQTIGSYFTWENIWGFLELPLTIFAAGATGYGQSYKQPTTTHTNCSKNLSGTEINCQSTNY